VVVGRNSERSDVTISACTRAEEDCRSEGGGWFEELEGNKDALESELKVLYERLRPFDGKRL
jgi:hypothetical protein